MKKKIDKYFSDNYELLTEAARVSIDVSNRNYDPVDLVSHAYEYCIKKIDEVTEENLPSYVHRVILLHCKWRTSPINRELLLKQTPFEGTEDFICRPVEVDNCDLKEKILLEKWFNDRKALLALYRERIKVDKPKQIVLDKMIELKTTNSRKLGKHFGIHYLSAYAYIREIQEELQDFENEVNNYDKKNNINR